MERANKPRSLFLKFLPRAASAVTFSNHPYSPGRDHKLKAHAHKGFSGPINFSALPDEARSKPNNHEGSSYDAQEPTSPKVSCMGQIKYKHKKKKLMKKAKKSPPLPSSYDDHDNINDHNKPNKQNKSMEPKRNSSALSKFFSRSPKPAATKSNGSPSDDHDNKNGRGAQDHNKKVVPNLSEMRKFASGRESLANFDWTAQIAPIDHDRECYSDEERGRDSDDDEDEEEREVIIPYSAPILVGGRIGGGLDLEPRKEVNLWKRRTLAPPPPLALNSKG